MVGCGKNRRLSAASVNKQYRPKKCPRCGTVFVPLSGRALYCFSCRR
ncbi:hypothetical protein SAMN02745218_02809 [Desulfofundulus australicus DSM 11792]|uniref:Uncharacterized protein n=1 Tax=Desulfofundulus australicus DSM 11792 TaxID=1121425 RepID=A0A1M5DFY6_9FIRM|nr:hypothetical protein [Desulfofundulus australicus]SHF65826.1 hypothetical protein SAMN02745218_02809 [Desulfofundulus australicus DSM 11792]